MNNKTTSFGGLVGVALLGMLVILFSNGLSLSGITAFDKTLLDEFQWTKGELKFRDFLNMCVAAFIVPFVGALIDRYGVKKIMSIGLILVSILVFSYSYIQNLIHIYAIHIGFAFAVACAGTMSVVIMVSQRVKENHGTALGIALAGTSLGGIVISRLSNRLLDNYDWRTAFQIEAVLPLIALVLIWVFLKPINYQKEEKNVDTGLTEIKFSQAIRSGTYWAICAAGFFCFYAILAIIGNLYLYLSELGYDRNEATNMFTIFFLIILAAKFLSGIITDYINKYLMFKLQLCCMIIGVVFFALNQPQFAWPGLIFVGVGWGGLYTLFNYTIITTFGVKNAGKINGLISTFEGIGAGAGSWLTGVISDKTGDYSMSFYLIVVFLVISLIISFFIKPLKANEG